MDATKYLIKSLSLDSIVHGASGPITGKPVSTKTSRSVIDASPKGNTNEFTLGAQSLIAAHNKFAWKGCLILLI